MQSRSVQKLLFENRIDRPVVVNRIDMEMLRDTGLLAVREFDR